MTIYCHSTRDSALLLSFLYTNLPSLRPLHPLSFHEMIFIPPFFRANARFVVRAQYKGATKNGPRPAGHTYLKNHVSQSENGVSFKAFVVCP